MTVFRRPSLLKHHSFSFFIVMIVTMAALQPVRAGAEGIEAISEASGFAGSPLVPGNELSLEEADAGILLEPGVLSYDVSLTSGWAALRSDVLDSPSLLSQRGNAGIDKDSTGSILLLPDRPEMLIIDTDGRPASFILRSWSDAGWSDWVQLSSDGNEQPDHVVEGDSDSVNSVGAIGPVWIGDGVEAVEIVDLDGLVGQVRIETIAALADTLEPGGTEASVSESTGLETSVGNATVRGEEFLQDLGQQSLLAEPGQVMLANAAVGQPVIQPRSAWASEGWAYGNEGCSDGPSYSDNVRTVVIHHTVTTNSYAQSQVDDLLRGIYRTHVKVNGWCDIGYNFVVDRFGTIWEARSGGADKPVIGGHARGFNTWSSGVALLGQHQSGASPRVASPSPQSLTSLAALASWKLGLHGIDPHGTTWMKSRTKATTGLRFRDGTWVEVPTILGHRDLGATSCPGSYVYSKLNDVRETSIRDLVVPFLVAGRSPQVSGPAFLTVSDSGGIYPGGAASFLVDSQASTPNIVAIAANKSRGYTLDSAGVLHGFGGLSSSADSVTGGAAAVDLVLIAGGDAGYVLDSDGLIHAFGGAPEVESQSAIQSAVSLAIDDFGNGYILDASGGLHAVGSSPRRSLPESVRAVDLGLILGSGRGWVLDRAGQLHPFGGAEDWQRHGGVFNGVARSVIVDPNGNGGWILDSEGRLDVFGDERVAAPLSTTVGIATAVDVALWWELPSELVNEDRAKYVSGLLHLFLGRDADLVELDRLGWKVDFFGAIAVADELANSDEWAGEIVDENYLGVLGRLPESEGRDYWVSRLRSGMRTQDLGAAFYSSPEYYASAGSDEAYVRRLYAALLHREADAVGLSHWVALLETGRARPIDIASGFYRSIESRSDRVTRLYLRVLQRDPDAEGLAFWSDRLFFEDDIALARDLSVSEEFYDRVTS